MKNIDVRKTAENLVTIRNNDALMKKLFDYLYDIQDKENGTKAILAYNLRQALWQEYNCESYNDNEI
jgi:hypothetical protein